MGRRKTSPFTTMIAQARYVTEVVSENSELKDLWNNSDEFDKWQTTVNDLQDGCFTEEPSCKASQFIRILSIRPKFSISTVSISQAFTYFE